jgi:hypothetical protein
VLMNSLGSVLMCIVLVDIRANELIRECVDVYCVSEHTC